MFYQFYSFQIGTIKFAFVRNKFSGVDVHLFKDCGAIVFQQQRFSLQIGIPVI